MHYTTVYRLL